MPHPAPRTSTDSPEERILVLAPTGRDAALTRRVLVESGAAAELCSDTEELCRKLEEGAGAVLVAEEALTQAALPRLLKTLETAAPWSDIPIIVLTARGQRADSSRRITDRIGALPNVTLLDRPIRTLILLSTVQSALRARRRQYELRDLLLRLQEAVQERDRFLAILGHELRNPLATILTAVEVLEQRKLAEGSPPSDEHGIIARQARHLARLVDDLLDVSRISAGKIVLERVPVDMTQVVQRALQGQQSAIRAHGHHLDFAAAPQAVMVTGDPLRLEQVVTNLLTNAIKYTPTRGHITVSVGVEDGKAVVCVRDDGIGIDPRSIDSIFDMFVQVDDSLDRSRGGLGIGLTLVKNLVEMHQGSVAAESPGIGRGSTFTIRLPLLVTSVRDRQAPKVLRKTAPRRVLLVEDSLDGRRVLQMLLRMWGHEVEVAEDGVEGVEKALALHPDVALVDIGLPLLDGYEVARQIRAALGDDVRLVALTGYGQPEDQRRASEAGFDLHLVKPVEPEALHEVIAAAPKKAPTGSTPPAP
jgi:signal transduction histidine kinase/ActR/RegA family two-component response regulator